MIGETILHYPPKADQPLADKIIEKLGEACLLKCYGRQGGPTLRFVHRIPILSGEGGSLYINLEISNDW